MQEMKKVVFINGSPKTTPSSASALLISQGQGLIKSESNIQTYTVNIRESITHNHCEEDFECMQSADALIFAFPLYVFCVPGIVMRFLQDFHDYIKKNVGSAGNIKVYAIVNCGFPEAGINAEAVRVIECFSKRIGAHFRFGIMVGGGGMFTDGVKDAPVMKKTFTALSNGFRLMAQDIQTNRCDPLQNLSINLNFPRGLYLLIADRSWVSLARKNRLKKKDLYRRPYELKT